MLHLSGYLQRKYTVSVCVCVRNKSIRVPYKKENIFIAISVCNLYVEATKRTLETKKTKYKNSVNRNVM